MSDFESVPQVRLLVLDDSNITSIADDTFGRLEQLERLSLNGNALTSVPSNLPSAGWLTALYLDGNRISTLHSGDLDGQQRLDQLHLARNVIESIAMGAFHPLTRLVVNILLFRLLTSLPVLFFLDAFLFNLLNLLQLPTGRGCIRYIDERWLCTALHNRERERWDRLRRSPHQGWDEEEWSERDAQQDTSFESL